MGERWEHALVLARRDVDPALEQVPEELGVPRPCRARESGSRRILGAEERQHRADALHAAEAREAGFEPCASGARARRRPTRREGVAAPRLRPRSRAGSRRASRPGRRRPRARAATSPRRAPPKAASGSPPPTILPRIVRSGRTPKRACAPPRATRKPVITSSKTSSAPVASHSIRRPSRKPGAGGTQPMFPATGSTRIAASPSPYRSTAAAVRVEVVVGDDDRVGGHAGGHARRRRDAERREPGAGARQEGVGVAVVAAVELDHTVAASERPREPDRRHRRLGARRDEPDALDRRHRVDDLGRQLDLALGRSAEGRPVERGLAHGLDRLVDRRGRR